MDRLGFFKHALSGLMDAATTVVGMKQAVESMSEAVDEALSNIKTDMCLHLPSLEAKMYEDPTNTLSELALMGYTTLEVGAYYGDTIHDQKVETFREMVRKAGLKVVAIHLNREYKPEPTPEESIGNDVEESAEEAPVKITAEQKWWSEALEVAKTLGCKRVVMAKVPAFPPEQTAQMAQTYAEYFARIAVMAQERGLEFCYHPAAAELKSQDGVSFLDYIATNAVAEMVKFQIDTFEVLQADVDICSLIRQYKQRIVSLHLHDRSIVCESGDIDFDAVVKFASQCGVDDLVVEVRHFMLPPMNCVERSIQNVMSLSSVRL